MTATSGFSYVAEHSNRAIPAIYNSRLVGRPGGSLLFMELAAPTYAAVVVFTNRRKHRRFSCPYVVSRAGDGADVSF
jgi:cytochrome c biogenesis factor